VNMSDEMIVIEIQDKISATIAEKLDGISAAAIGADLAIATLQANLNALSASGIAGLQANLAGVSAATESLTAAQMSALAAIEALGNSMRQGAIESEALAVGQNEATLSATNLEIATINAAIATEALKVANNNVLISNEKVIQAQNQTAISLKNVSIASDKAAMSALKLKGAQNEVNKTTEHGNQLGFSSLRHFMMLAMVAGVAAVGTKAIMGLGNSYLELQNKLKVVSDSELQTEELTNRLFESARRARVPVEDLATAFQRYDMALKPLGASQEQTLKMTENISKSLTLGGANTIEAAQSLLQLSQAFNRNNLQADEFRTLMRNAPILMQALADSLGVPKGELMNLSKQGKLTGKVMLDAFTNMKIDDKFARSTATVNQAVVILKNDLIQLAGEFEKTTGSFSGFAAKLINIADSIKNNKYEIFSLGETTIVTATAIGDLANSIFLLDGSKDKTKDSLNALEHLIRGLGFTAAMASDIIRELAGGIATLVGKTANLASDDNFFTVWGKNALGAKGATDKFLEGLEQAKIKLAELEAKKNEPTKPLVSHGKSYLRQASDDTSKPPVDPLAESRAMKLKKINDELNKEQNSLQILEPSRSIYNKMTEIEIQLADKKNGKNSASIKLSKQEHDSILNKITAIETEKKVSGERDRIFESSIAPMRDYLNTIAATTQLLDKKKISEEEATKQINLARIAMINLTEPLFQYNKQLSDESTLLNYVGREQEAQTRLMQLKNDAYNQGIPLDEVQILLYKMEIDNLIKKNALNQEQNNIYAATGGAVVDFNTKLQALNNEILKGADKSAGLMTMFGDMFDGTQIALDAETKKWDLFYKHLETLAKTNVITTKQYEQAKSVAWIKEHEKQFQQADQFFGNMSSLQNSKNRELFEIGKAAAVAQATVNGFLAISEAQKLGPIVGTALAIAAGVAMAANIASIMSTKMPGYEAGGYTGDGGTSQVAGVVHGREFVVSAPATARNRPMLEAMNRGASVGNSVSIKIENYGTSKTFAVEQIDENRYRIIAKDEAEQAIEKRVPSLVASEIGNPNSKTSKSLSQSTNIVRRR